MSTILKALRQSEARRPRESALGAAPPPGAAGPGRRRLALAGALAILGAALAVWWLMPLGGVAPPRDSAPQRGVAEVSLPERADVAGEDPAHGGTGGEAPESPGPASDAKPDAGSAASEPTAPAEGEPLPGMGGDEAKPPAPPRPADTITDQESPKAPSLQAHALLPRLADLGASRRDALPELNLNAHVYAPEPGQSFVLIDLTRYGEGDLVAPGLRVTEIFPGGVVLEDSQGRFVLPRP